ncbi:MAG: hypothetical protein FJZ86_06485 [Chloroflexi bacterium]|nr:hypothetical protein [Chloroflexota bacterium]
MYLIIVFLHNPNLLEELMEAWDQEGVNGATILFSVGMGQFLEKLGLRDDIPLIPSLEDFYEASEKLSRTIMATVKEEALIDRIVAATQRVMGDLNKPETGMLLVMPVLKAYGLYKTGRTK